MPLYKDTFFKVQDVIECTHWPLIGEAGSVDISVELTTIPSNYEIEAILKTIDRLDHMIISGDPEVKNLSERYAILDGTNQNALLDILRVFIPLLKIELNKIEMDLTFLEDNPFEITVSINKLSMTVSSSLDEQSELLEFNLPD